MTTTRSQIALNIFCDFDGVINAFPHEITFHHPIEPYKQAVEGVDYDYRKVTTNPLEHYTLDQETILEGMPITYSSELIEFVNTLTNHPRIQFHWLSTWNDRLPKIVMPALGITGNTLVHPWKLLGMSDYAQQGKTHSISNYYHSLLRKGQDLPPFIWLEDVAALHYAVGKDYRASEESIFTQYHESAGTPSRLRDLEQLIIAPNERYGLTRRDTSHIEDFLLQELGS